MRRKICKAPGCCRLVDADSGLKYCEEHQHLQRKLDEKRFQGFSDKARHGMWDNLYQSPKWRAMRAEKLRAQPLCEVCGEKATEVHHIIPHDGDLSVFYDESNLQSICHRCHVKHTIEEMKARKALRKATERKLWY